MTEVLQTPEHEWMMFPGGELEGRRPKRLCSTCRERLRRSAMASAMESAVDAAASAGETDNGNAVGAPRPLCFQCYRVDLDRERALKVAGELDTASVARFQEALPFAPVNRSRLSTLKMARAAARPESSLGAGRFVDRRRQAQIAARHVLQAIGAGLRQRQLMPEAARATAMAAVHTAVHAAELQLPESWLPFVIAG